MLGTPDLQHDAKKSIASANVVWNTTAYPEQIHATARSMLQPHKQATKRKATW
jgi:hypothetical protein